MRIAKGGPERIADLEPLWRALQEHHTEIAPILAGLPARCSDEAWRLRHLKYEALLSTPGAFVMVAENDEQLIGYALVHLAEGSVGYETGSLVGEVETLSVAPQARRHGVGTALMDAVEHELVSHGIDEVRLGVMAGNDDAVGFYQRRGMGTFAHVLIGKLNGGVRSRS